MPNVTKTFRAITGKTLFAFPENESLVDWLTLRRPCTESASPDLGRYSVSLSTEHASYLVYEGTAVPASHASDIGVRFVLSEQPEVGGQFAIEFTVSDNTVPIPGAMVTVKYSGAIVRWKRTDSSGTAAFTLDAGDYTVSVSAFGFDNLVDSARTVVGNESFPITLSETSVTPPPMAGMCVVDVKTMRGSLSVGNCSVTVRLEDQKSMIPEGVQLQSVMSLKTDANGTGQLILPYSSSILFGSGIYKIEVIDPVGSVSSHSRRFVVPDLTNAVLSDLPSP